MIINVCMSVSYDFRVRVALYCLKGRSIIKDVISLYLFYHRRKTEACNGYVKCSVMQ